MQRILDWQAIRDAYEQGVSQCNLAKQYGVSQQAISKRAKRYSWQVVERVIPKVVSRQQDTTDNNAPQPDEPLELLLAIVQVVLRQLAEQVQRTLDLREHKLLADCLSQHYKILLTAQPAPQTVPGMAIDSETLPYLEPDDLSEIRRRFDLAAQRKAEAESKITPIRKMQ